MDIAQQCAKFCRVVASTPEMTNATARIGTWMFGVAAASGGFPIELTYRQIRDGVEINNKTIPGTGSRHETIRASIDWLKEHGILTYSDGDPIGFGHMSRKYSMKL